MINLLQKLKANPLVKKSIFYMFFNALNGAIPFFLLPVLTYYLSPDEYGTVSLFQTTLMFIVPLVGLSMGFNIDRLFFKISKEELSVTMANMLYILIAMTAMFSLLIFVSSFFSEFKFIGLPFKWLILIPLLASFSNVNAFNLIILRNIEEIGKFGFFQVGLTFVNLSLSILFVVSLTYGWQGRATGIGFATVLFGLLSLWNIYKMGYVKFIYSKEEVKSILYFTLPLLFQGLGTFVIFQSNRYFINGMESKFAVGIFSIAYAFAALMGIFQDALAKTINPWFYKNLNSVTENFKAKLLKMNFGLNLLLIVITFIIYFVATILIRFMTEEKYHSAISLVFLLTLGLAFNGMYKFSSVYFIHLLKTKLLSYLTGITAVISILLNYVFIKAMGLEGAAYAFCISLFVQFILTYMYAQKIYPLPVKEVVFLYVKNIQVSFFKVIKFIKNKPNYKC